MLKIDLKIYDILIYLGDDVIEKGRGLCPDVIFPDAHLSRYRISRYTLNPETNNPTEQNLESGGEFPEKKIIDCIDESYIDMNNAKFYT